MTSRTTSPPLDEWINKATAAIMNGGVVALPFERLFGLAADALDPRAVVRSAAAKDREKKGSRPISVIVPNMEALKLLTDHLSPVALDLAKMYWPGPMTMLVRAREGLPAQLVSSTGLIGVRLPGWCPALALAQATGKILTATSANKPGRPDSLTHETLVDLEHVDMLIHGTVPGPPGSTFVDATGDKPVILRQGITQISGLEP